MNISSVQTACHRQDHKQANLLLEVVTQYFLYVTVGEHLIQRLLDLLESRLVHRSPADHKTHSRFMQDEWMLGNLV